MKASFLTLATIALFCQGVPGALNLPVKVSATHPRILVDQNNAPFMIVGDSPHAIFVNLTTAEAADYLADRAARGINSLWVNLICIRSVEGRPDSSLLDGTRPFTKMIPGTHFYDLTTPNEAYFSHVDAVLRLAEGKGIVVMLDPLETAGLLQTALVNGSKRCGIYGRYLGSRYKDFSNIVWLNGNDFQGWATPTNDAVILSVALGIKGEDTNHLQTIELNYQASCSLDDTNWSPIVGLNLAYSYYATYAEVLRGYNQSAAVPAFMGEANFEDETNNQEDGGSQHILRMQEYWTMLSGAAGQLYGHKYMWRFLPGWRDYLNSPGIVQLGYLAKLFGERKWYDLIPDQAHVFVTAGYGTFAASGPPATASTSRFADNDYVTAALTQDGSLGMAYLPQGGTITVDMSRLGKTITARWFDPADNTFKSIDGSPFSNSGPQKFTAPGKNNSGEPDWLLVLEAPRNQAPVESSM